MAGSVSARGGIKNDINITPLIDVVLVLLIIFMVVTPLLERGKSVQLPRSQTKDEQSEPDVLILSLPKDHTLWLDATPVTEETLAPRLRQALAEHPGRNVMLKADRSLSVGDVRAALAAARAAGVNDVTLGVDDGEHAR